MCIQKSTASVRLEHSQPERKVVSSSHKPERWLSSEQMLCERLQCPNGELNALGPPTQDPH